MEGLVLCQREGVENGKNNTLQKKELKRKGENEIQTGLKPKINSA